MTTSSNPLKWHGGKSYLAAKFIAMMPPHTHYVEPYFGGGAVLFAKEHEGVSEVVNDLNCDLFIFWLVMRDEIYFEAFRRMAEGTPFSQMEWDNAHGNLQRSRQRLRDPQPQPHAARDE